MLIVGAGGLAKEILEIVHELNIENLYFFDDINENNFYLYDKYTILKNDKDVLHIFSKNNLFTIGIGKPLLRKRMYDKFIFLGGKIISLISNKAHVGSFGTIIGEGAVILQGAIITNDVVVGKCVLLNPNTTVSHDVKIGNFVECSPGVCITGNVKIGDFTYIGTNATILPNINIGKNVTIGAGAVVTKDIPDNSLVVGIPARIIKKLEPL